MTTHARRCAGILQHMDTIKQLYIFECQSHAITSYVLHRLPLTPSLTMADLCQGCAFEIRKFFLCIFRESFPEFNKNVILKNNLIQSPYSRYKTKKNQQLVTCTIMHHVHTHSLAHSGWKIFGTRRWRPNAKPWPPLCVSCCPNWKWKGRTDFFVYHIYIHIYIYLVHICMYIYKICVCVRVYMYIHIHTYTCMCIRLCVCMYIYTHTHTNI